MGSGLISGLRFSEFSILHETLFGVPRFSKCLGKQVLLRFPVIAIFAGRGLTGFFPRNGSVRYALGRGMIRIVGASHRFGSRIVTA